MSLSRVLSRVLKVIKQNSLSCQPKLKLFDENVQERLEFNWDLTRLMDV